MGFKPEKVAELVSRTFNEMIFIHGDVHCDPHAANLFLRKDEATGQLQLVLLDHGLYRQAPMCLPHHNCHYSRTRSMFEYNSAWNCRNLHCKRPLFVQPVLMCMIMTIHGLFVVIQTCMCSGSACGQQCMCSGNACGQQCMCSTSACGQQCMCSGNARHQPMHPCHHLQAVLDHRRSEKQLTCCCCMHELQHIVVSSHASLLTHSASSLVRECFLFGKL